LDAVLQLQLRAAEVWRGKVPELLLEFVKPVLDETGKYYLARAMGRQMPDAMWHAWLEFVPADGRGVIATDRETTQPNRTDAEYWATGLTEIYLEGALNRAKDRVTTLETHLTPSLE
jgi:hypothetical protein